MRVGNLLVISRGLTAIVDLERELQFEMFDVDLVRSLVQLDSGDFAVASRVQGDPTEWHLFRHRGGFGRNVSLWYPGKPEAGLRIIFESSGDVYGFRESGSDSRTALVRFGSEALEVVESVPPVPKRQFDVVCGAVRLGDGTRVAVFDGDGYELKDGEWSRSFKLGIQNSFVDFTSAPGASDGFYYLSNRELYHARRGARPERLMPDASNVMGIAPGPDGSLLTWFGTNKRSHVVRVFYPEDGTYIPLIKKQIAPDTVHLHCSELTYFPKTGLLYILTSGALFTIPWSDVQSLKRVKPRNKPGHKRSAPARLKKQLEEAVAAPVPEEQKPSDPLDVVLHSPRDLDAREVLADALQEQGDRHGELIALGCRRQRAHRAGEPFDATALEALEQELRPELLKRWNDPIRLFPDDVALYAGFPNTFRVTKLHVNDVPAVDAQLKRIPITNLHFNDLGSATSKALKLEVVRRATDITLHGSSRTRMSRAVSRALIKAKPRDLENLRSYNLELDGPIFKELFNVCPKLTTLTLTDANLDAEAMVDVAQAGSFENVKEFCVMSCGCSSEGIGAFLGAAPNCSELDVSFERVSDEITKSKPVAPLERLRISSDSRNLTGKGVCWFLESFPQLRELYIEDPELAGQSALQLVAALEKSGLEKLRLTFEDSGPALELAGRLPENLETLKLEFDGSARFDGTKKKKADQVLEALAQNPAIRSLKRLELGGPFAESTAIGLVQSGALAKLEKLSFGAGHRSLGDKLLAEVFRKLPELREITVWYPNIKDVESLLSTPKNPDTNVVLFASKQLRGGKRTRLEEAWGERLRVI